MSHRYCSLLLVTASSSSALLGAAPSTAVDADISFTLDDDDASSGDNMSRDQGDWRHWARRAAALEPLECTNILLEATSEMLEAAGQGDSLAMAALGSMYLLGQIGRAHV